jgi:DNA-binding NarL/FixJ family response regulator
VRVLVVDDSELLRQGLEMLLGTVEDVEVVATAADGREALAAVNTTRPEVVLTDARMPVLDGIGLVAAMAERHPGIPVIVLTTFDDEALVRAALAAGAVGFLLKDSGVDALVGAMRSVLEGGLVLDPRVARIALRPEPAADASPLAVLTRTERAVAVEIASGASNSEIAATLFMAEGTVKNHVSALLRKLDRRDRTALALFLARYL